MDIMMCSNEKCELKDGCLRFIVTPRANWNSVIAEPEEYCVLRSHELFVEAEFKVKIN